MRHRFSLPPWLTPGSEQRAQHVAHRMSVDWCRSSSHHRSYTCWFVFFYENKNTTSKQLPFYLTSQHPHKPAISSHHTAGKSTAFSSHFTAGKVIAFCCIMHCGKWPAFSSHPTAWFRAGLFVTSFIDRSGRLVHLVIQREKWLAFSSHHIAGQVAGPSV